MRFTNIRKQLAFREHQKRFFSKMSETFLDLKIERLRKTKRVYQPAFIPDLDWKLDMTEVERISLASQISAITSRIEEFESILDVGSNLGYISLNLARQFPHSIVSGFEPDRELVEAANRSAEKAMIKNIKFQGLDINPINVKGLPIFDNTIFLSVYQQWVRSYGMEQSKIMIDTLFEKTKKRMFFSMASTNGSPKILEYFPDMGDSLEESDRWIVENVLNFPNSNVENLGRYETKYGSSLPRTLFLVRRK